MNFKKIFSDSNSKASFFAGVIVAFAVFLLFNSPYALQGLKLVESQTNGFQIQLSSEREVVELVLD